MREILYRAKTKDGKHWIQGGFFKHLNRTLCMGESLKEEDFDYYIISSGFSDWNMPKPIEVREILPESVGAYTGKDIGMEKIFENDIILYMHYDKTCEQYEEAYGVVFLSEKGWRLWVLGEDKDDEYFGQDSLSSLFRHTVPPKIVGNLLDNPEILKLFREDEEGEEE